MSSENQQKVFSFLETHKISYEVVNHPPVFTIEEMDALCMENPGIVKNLFVRDDKKKRYYLILLAKNKNANLKDLRIKITSRPLSFASEEDLMKYLGLTKGSVTPFGVLNDPFHTVTIVIDSDLLEYEYLGVHPNDNTATVWISVSDLVSVIEGCGNEIIYVDLSE